MYHSDNCGVAVRGERCRSDREQSILIAVDNVCEVAIANHDQLLGLAPAEFHLQWSNHYPTVELERS